MNLVKERRPRTRRPSEAVQRVSIDAIYESPENRLLYRNRSTDNADFRRLVESVSKNGIESPLLVSLDGYIISGHQRFQAAIRAGLDVVPVIVKPLRRSKHTRDQWTAVLREHNTGREKSFDEVVREKLVDLDPARAAKAVVLDRIERARLRIETIQLDSAEVKRHRISAAKREFADAILEVLRDLQDYLPVSVRQCHYSLLNSPPLRNSTKPDSRYRNDLKSYHDLSDMLTRMRFSGEVAWDSLIDETRMCTEWTSWSNAGEFIEQQIERLLTGYSRNSLQSQPCHVEIVCEKLTVKSIIETIAGQYDVPVLIGRGNSSADARHRMRRRFQKSGKDKLVLLVLGDCDPDGDSIVESFVRSMRDEFYIPEVEGVRVGITHQQADELGLPKTLEAKESSENFAKFVKRHGRRDAYELEAVSPEVLQRWTDEAIRSVLDIEAFNAEVEKQNTEATEIAARREAILELMKRS